MRLHTFHGVLADWTGDRLSDRLYVPRKAFEAWLERSPSKYVALQRCGPDETALTIDDSTIAGAEACLIARRLGHEVTLFLNPHQIITQTPYFFTILNLAIDQLAERARRTNPKVSWRAPQYVALRQQARSRLISLADGARDSELRRSLSAWDLEMPRAAPEHHPIDLSMLTKLVAAGVQIGNHGWSHIDIASLSEDSLCDDITRARQWLRDATGQAVDAYAVPFGLATPPAAVLQQLNGPCLLVDASRPVGELAPGLINRTDITDGIQEWAPSIYPGDPRRRCLFRHAGRRTTLSVILGAIAIGLVLTLLTLLWKAWLDGR